MTDTQPPHLTPGPTPSGAIEDELELPPPSAEDRKAAAALSALDTHNNDDGGAAGKQEVDVEAVRKAMDRLGGGGAGGKEAGEGGKKKEEEEVRKVVKVEAGDVKVVVSSSLAWIS